MKIFKIIISIFVVFALLSGCNKRDEEHKGHGEAGEDEGIVLDKSVIKMIGLKIERVKRRQLKREIKLPGQIVPNNDTLQHIYPRYPGLVLKVYKSLGDRVIRGGILAKVQNNNTLTTYEIRSLLGGTVIKKQITVGDIVKDDDEIFAIANLNNVWVEFDVYTKDSLYVKKGQVVKIEAIDIPQKVNGTISHISPIFNKERRSVTARVVLQNKYRNWKPGIYVKGTLHLTTADVGIAVPNEAIQVLEEKKVVFIPKNDTHFIMVVISTGKNDDKYTIVTSGLSLKDQIVTIGAFELKAKIVTSGIGHGHAH